MSDARDPLSRELEDFLAPERRRPDPPAEIRDQLFSRIGATLALPGGPGPGGSGSTGGGAAPANPAGGAGAGQLAAHGARHLVAGSLSRTLVTLAVGGALGAGVHEAYDRAYDRASHRRADHAKVDLREERLPAPASPPAAPPSPATPAGAPGPAPAAATGARAESPAAQPERAPRVEPRERERDRGLGAERALIEQARTALAREKYTAAVEALERHAREFPGGELEEERESLQIQALVGLERFDQARKAAARFRRRFPRSIFTAVVDEALRSIP
jgi:hypothetical protein